MKSLETRRLPVGAEPRDGGVSFRLWAPRRRRMVVEVEGRAPVELSREADGYFSGFLPGAGPGALYRFRGDEGPALPDPASRFQPGGPHGPSEVVSPSFAWTDARWPGLRLKGQVLYELHVGTFTQEGTYAAAARFLPELKSLGITAVELMPVAEFPGRFGWGYDGVDLFAPTRLYGRPEDLRAFVDRAHGLGLGVLLDVVYNHLGPDGNYLREFSSSWFSEKHTEWGEAFNFDGPGSAPVREFMTTNAAYWVSEFHLDGLRLDATQSVFDGSPEHVLGAVAAAARRAAGAKPILLIAENEPQQAGLLRPRSAGGCGLDALWNDDFHHSAFVALTGRTEAYFSDYRGAPQELISAVKRGFLYQGQRYAWQDQRRGSPALRVGAERFVTYLEDHDQVPNTLRGRRRHQTACPGDLRALTALWLLAPGTPMFFQGQEFAASTPFHYFADHHADLAVLVRDGRAAFLKQFRSLAGRDMAGLLPDPSSEALFRSCKLKEEERRSHVEALALHRSLLGLRRADPVFAAQRSDLLEGAVLGPHALVLRFASAAAAQERLLLVNLGRDLDLTPCPEPLLAPPEGGRWELLWSSEDPAFGGGGSYRPVDDEQRWRLAGHAAAVLEARHG